MSSSALNRRFPRLTQTAEYLFLANIDPLLQARVRSQMANVRMVCGDTMNYWISSHAENLAKVLRELDVLLINDGEARMLSGEQNSVRAAEKVLAMGPKSLVMKHGEYGATGFFGRVRLRVVRCRGLFRAPALPLAEVVIRPARATRLPADLWVHCVAAGADAGGLSAAMFYGGVMGSFACERFGTERLQAVTRREIEARFEIFREISHLDCASV